MIAVSITIVDDTRGRVVEAAICDTIPVAELIPHLVDATAGEHWRLSGPGGILRPEHCLTASGVRPGERLTLERATMPAPPPTSVEELTEEIPDSPAVWIAALLTAMATVIAVPLAPINAGAPVWHPLEMTDRARSILDGAGDPAGAAATVYTLVVLLTAIAVAAGSLHDRRFLPVAAILGFGVGLQVNVLIGCVFAALLVWRPGPERVFTITLGIAAAVNLWPGLSALLAMAGLVLAGHIALGISGVPLPRIPATGLFTAQSNHCGDEFTATAVGRARRIHPALVIACCVILGASVVQLIPLHSQPGWMTALGCVALAVTGLSARGCRPVHSIAVTVTMSAILVWTMLHCPSPWPVVALLPLAVPAVAVVSPLMGRVIDVLETIAFAAAVPLLVATTGVFDLIRGIG